MSAAVETASAVGRLSPHTPSNNGMHPTRNSAALILYGSGGRVMPGVRWLAILKANEARQKLICSVATLKIACHDILVR